MSSNGQRNLRANPADVEALDSLQHMTSWARQSVVSPEAVPASRFSGLVDHFALGATAFYAGPWDLPIDVGREAAVVRETRPSGPGVATRTLRATGGAIVRFWNYMQERRAIARATAHLAEMDDRALQDIGLTRADIGDAVRHGRDWHRWR